jgi:hypothetical protein
MKESVIKQLLIQSFGRIFEDDFVLTHSYFTEYEYLINKIEVLNSFV